MRPPAPCGGAAGSCILSMPVVGGRPARGARHRGRDTRLRRIFVLTSHPSRAWRAGLLGILALVLVGTALAPLPPAAAQTGTIPHTDVNPYGANVFLHKEAEQEKVIQTLDLAAQAILPGSSRTFSGATSRLPRRATSRTAATAPRKAPGTSTTLSWTRPCNATCRWWPASPSRPIGRAAPAAAPTTRPRTTPTWPISSSPCLNHYQGRVKYVQVWNEPNLAYEWKAGGKVDPGGLCRDAEGGLPARQGRRPQRDRSSARPWRSRWRQIDYAGNLNELDYWDQMYQAGAKDYLRHPVGQRLWPGPAARRPARARQAELPPRRTAA